MSRRHWPHLIALALVAALVGAAGLSQAAPERQVAGSRAYLPLLSGGSGVAPQPTLVSAYRIWGPQPDYSIVRYRPRQFAAGLDVDEGPQTLRVDAAATYAGWDVLVPPNREVSLVLDLKRWVDITLTRPASVAIVWRGGQPLPAWLQGWEPGPSVRIGGQSAPTYRRHLAAGEHSFGAVFDPGALERSARQTYLVLLAEAGGAPSAPPAVPAGKAPPQPNATCPQWVHEQYVTAGPDGKIYPTWHPQIDPVYWCYFHHEHGSHPGRHRPAFGYASQLAGVDEGHPGFKVYRFLYDGGVEIIITHHFGTASAKKAACVRFHSYDMVVYRGAELVADLRLMADHGRAQHARTDRDLTPADCPNQAAEALADGSEGSRKFQISTLDPVGYEPWRIDFQRVTIAKLTEFAVNTVSRITDCNSFACDEDVPTGDQGEFRYATHGNHFGVQAAQHTGTFFSDPRGRTVLAPGAAGAVRQFVAPGASVALPVHGGDHECYITHPFGGTYVCQQYGPELDMNIEGALRSPN